MFQETKAIAVVNASPLIYLGKIGKLEVLNSLFTEVVTTKEVKCEVLRLDQAPEHIALYEAFNKWLSVRKPENISLVTKLEKLQIHKGEASVLVVAKEIQSEKKKTVVVIDDLAARDIARSMGLTITGTIGILLRSVNEKLLTVQQCKSLLTTLNRETDFRITVIVYTKIVEYLETLEAKK